MTRPFVHLHVKSQYSLLNGAIRLPKLMPRLEALGMNAVAITDDGNMFGAVDFFKKAKKSGIKPIIGIEIYVATDMAVEDREAGSLVLLARTDVGYKNLCTLSSMSWMKGLAFGKPRVDLKLLAAHNEGIIALSGDYHSQIGQAIVQGQDAQAEQLAVAYRDTFEPGAFYLEVIPSGLGEQTQVNEAFRTLGDRLGIPLVAGGDCRYLDRKFARAHDVLMCIAQGKTLDSKKRIKLDTDQLYLKSGDEMWAELGERFADALENTQVIADLCEAEIELGEIYLPDFPVPEGYDTDSWLIKASEDGLEARYAEFAAVGKTVDKEVYAARLEEELGIIINMGFPGYFLIVEDFINWAKDNDIAVGPGRGSGAGSLVAYSLRITDIDPIPYGLLFERFLNPERVSMPDFDIDFCMNRRLEVVDYCTRKYGEVNVGMIATYGSLKAKGVIKDVGRVLGMPFADTDRLSKLIPDVLGISLDEALEQEPKLREIYDQDDRAHDLLDIARALEGLLRQTGMHAAGVVIGDHHLWHYCPIFTANNGELVTQYAKEEVEEAGLVKFDFLGLKTLTVIDDAVRMVNRGRAPEDALDMAKLSLDDPKVYALISRADTEGVFQLESSGFQELLKKLRPDVFEDIVAAVALYRPGPLNSGMLDDFIERKHGKQKITYPHESLKPILEDTYGVIVYQEQVMQIAQVLAGYTLGAADILRRAMGKKKMKVMAEQRIIFGEGAKANGVDPQVADNIFDLMEMFAEYGFNKSHSAAYALLTYFTAYLKAHHTTEFMAALLTNDRDNSEKVSKGIRNAKAIGVEVLPPDINRSIADFDAVDGKILFGMAGIRGVGSTAVEGIVAARDEGGPFSAFFEFCERVDLRRVNKKTIEALIKTGAFDAFGHPRQRLLAVLDAAVDRGQRAQQDKAAGQASFFDALAAPPSADTPEGDDFPAEVMRLTEWPEKELLAYEKASLGFYVSGHPLDRFRDQIRKYSTASVETLHKAENYSDVVLAGICTSVRVRPFKNGDGKMAIILFEDLTGTIEIVAMGDIYDKYEELLSTDEPLLITGTIRADREDPTNISVRMGGRRRRNAPPAEDEKPLVLSLAAVRAERSNAIELSVPTASLNPNRVQALAEIFHNPEFHGECRAVIKLMTGDDCRVTLKVPATLAPSDALSHAIQSVLGRHAVLRAR